ncbi:hypothetical protein NUW54_g9952 [Trametes sanguinea]|uniref:Uncharacterized protein n=1 Tax=Trametes sanguinea TaxID=158606 RepID=A0ACC1P2M5_9APHY|nr:hypothetical protein NUW54_g9952 [Trametes sanguinea]
MGKAMLLQSATVHTRQGYKTRDTHAYESESTSARIRVRVDQSDPPQLSTGTAQEPQNRYLYVPNHEAPQVFTASTCTACNASAIAHAKEHMDSAARDGEDEAEDLTDPANLNEEIKQKRDVEHLEDLLARLTAQGWRERGAGETYGGGRCAPQTAASGDRARAGIKPAVELTMRGAAEGAIPGHGKTRIWRDTRASRAPPSAFAGVQGMSFVSCSSIDLLRVRGIATGSQSAEGARSGVRHDW